MKVSEGMTQVVLSVGPAHTLRQAAKMMAMHRVGAAVVLDAERSGIGILTERDILNSLAADQDPDTEFVSEHRTPDVVFATPDWTLEQAAETMVASGFRHLVVVNGGEVAGLLSMRDIVRCWSSAGAVAAGGRSAVGS
ncbi:MAG TPA: CBS domain-containing protein [Streptosporangiaceae bacterium]|nr:CBS domain-containing protein [Streptosporangiaceae bacterium]